MKICSPRPRALVERAELAPSGFAAGATVEPVVVGFRRNGAASIFFGQDVAYHFNSTNELRRAFLAGILYKADRGRLAALERRRQADVVQLIRHDLSDEETRQFLVELCHRVNGLREAISTGRAQILRQEPAGTDMLPRIVQWLDGLRDPITIARNPRVN